VGRATIISGGDDGRYTIEVDTGGAQQQAKIDALNARIASLTADLATANAALSDAQADVEAQQSVVAQAVDAYVLATQASDNPADWKPALQAHRDAMAVLMLMQGEAATLRTRRDMLALELSQAQRELTLWDSLPIVTQRQAWCVDYTDDGAGEVATAEIDGEQDLILIQAGCRPPVGGDGVLLARWVQSPEQAYSNAAILPGWQKWKPTYRTGTITALDTDADTADVDLDAATSSAQSLDINQAPTSLSAVPVVYMECNAEAFEVSDRCVVEFQGQDWASPRVVGFVDNPKPCIEWPAELSMTVVFDVGRIPAYGPSAWHYTGEVASGTPCGPTPQYSFYETASTTPNTATLGSIILSDVDFVVVGAPQNASPQTMWSDTANSYWVPIDGLDDTVKMWPPSGGGAGHAYFFRTTGAMGDDIALSRFDKSFPGPTTYTQYAYVGGECLIFDSKDCIDVTGPVIETYQFGPCTYGELVQELGYFVPSFTLTWRGTVSRTYAYTGSVKMSGDGSGGSGRLIYQLVED
jgi:hypothetical protein